MDTLRISIWRIYITLQTFLTHINPVTRVRKEDNTLRNQKLRQLTNQSNGRITERAQYGMFGRLVFYLVLHIRLIPEHFCL